MSASLLVIDKPAGPTSYDVVREIKKNFRHLKIGHGGSLDPFATGVLVCLLGRATKLSTALLNADKVYRGKIKLGEATDTMDCKGTVTKKLDIPELDSEKIRKVFLSFTGEWMQTPPMYSAKKLRGVRLYELARKQILVNRPAIPVQIYEMVLLSLELPFIEFRVHCSKGTYIRSLADELGGRLGTAGHLSELRREAVGCFSLKDSIQLSEVEKNPQSAWDLGIEKYAKLLGQEQRFVSASTTSFRPWNDGGSRLPRVGDGGMTPWIKSGKGRETGYTKKLKPGEEVGSYKT